MREQLEEYEQLETIPEEWEKTWAEWRDMAVYALPDGDYAITLNEYGNYYILQKGNLTLNHEELDWHEVEKIYLDKRIPNKQASRIKSAVEELVMEVVPLFTIPQSEINKPGEVIEMSGDFLVVDISRDLVNEVTSRTPDSSESDREVVEALVEMYDSYLLSVDLRLSEKDTTSKNLNQTSNEELMEKYDFSNEETLEKYDLFINISSAPEQERIDSLPNRPLTYDEVANFTESLSGEAWIIDPMGGIFDETIVTTDSGQELSEDEAVLMFSVLHEDSWITFSLEGGQIEQMAEAKSGWYQLKTVEHESEVDLDEEMQMGSMGRLSDLR